MFFYLAKTPPAENAVTGAILSDFVIPLLGILVPTLIAIGLFRAERKNAREDAVAVRRLDAGAQVIVALAPMASIQADQPMQERLWELRARIAVYRSCIDADDLSGDWLALRHLEGMKLWGKSLDDIDAAGGVHRVLDEEIAQMLRPAHEWSATTVEMFSAWLSHNLPTSSLQSDGARIMETYGEPPRQDWQPATT
ncbi:hypothetical protein ACFVAE_03775 [Microbacterium sp. NPDC057659]|uniref:hypothetical protein n=1 Tax=Microbacterium sp. NPDC057659 TaxID=3346198 RepID=UPI00366BA206